MFKLFEETAITKPTADAKPMLIESSGTFNFGAFSQPPVQGQQKLI